jgi:hypothetical protein
VSYYLSADELENGDGTTGARCVLAVTGERREDAVGELPEPGAGRLVIDDLDPEWLSAE